MTPELESSEVPAWAVRLEAKVDIALTQHAARLDSHSLDLADHEARIRVQEQRATVSPAGLWAAVVSAVAVAGGLMAIVSGLIPH